MRVRAGYMRNSLSHSTDAQYRGGAPYLIVGSHDAQRYLAFLLADGSYAGLKLHAAIALFDRPTIAIVRRSYVVRVVVFRCRWLVQRAFARLNRCRRDANDWGNLCMLRSVFPFRVDQANDPTHCKAEVTSWASQK